MIDCNVTSSWIRLLSLYAHIVYVRFSVLLYMQRVQRIFMAQTVHNTAAVRMALSVVLTLDTVRVCRDLPVDIATDVRQVSLGARI